MVQNAMDEEEWDLDQLDFLFIENVGNLVCPSSYDLGEDLRVVLLSVTEGEDKPLKYPTIFNSADVAIITKSDLAEAVEFDCGGYPPQHSGCPPGHAGLPAFRQDRRGDGRVILNSWRNGWLSHARPSRFKAENVFFALPADCPTQDTGPANLST